MTSLTRRQIFAAAASVGAAAAQISKGSAPTLCIFSKHLAFLDYLELARTLVDLRVPGCDLTVRPRGHVEPENVARDLPRAHAALAEQGITVPMITTGLLSADEPAARPTLETANALGIPLFKLVFNPAAAVPTFRSVWELCIIPERYDFVIVFHTEFSYH